LSDVNTTAVVMMVEGILLGFIVGFAAGAHFL